MREFLVYSQTDNQNEGGDMNYLIRPIALKEIYISVLKEKRVTNEEGWTRKVPVSHEVRPSGSIILDTAIRVMYETKTRSASELAEKMGVPLPDLNGALRILTNFGATELIEQYRLMQAQEYLACTDLTYQEIARRCGFTHYNSFHKMFKRLTGICVLPFRKKYRPANYRELYGWE